MIQPISMVGKSGTVTHSLNQHDLGIVIVALHNYHGQLQRELNSHMCDEPVNSSIKEPSLLCAAMKARLNRVGQVVTHFHEFI